MKGCSLFIALWVSFSVYAENEEAFSFNAKATGVGPTAQIEFILISPDSGHDYESIAISSLSPDQLYEGITRLGAQPGWPVNRNALKFYPRGERLNITFAWEQDGTNHSVSAHKLIVDESHGGHLIEDYFTFTGSTWITNNGARTLAATINDPGSILSTYNDHETLIDRPIRASKGGVYGTLYANPETIIPEGTEIEVTIRRVKQDETFQPVDATVSFSQKNGQTYMGVTFLDLSDELLLQNGDSFLRAALTWKEKYPEIALNPVFDQSLSLKSIQLYASWLAVAEEKADSIVLPPKASDLFFRSFLPPPAFRDPAKRPSQPWEVKLINEDQNRTTAVISRHVTESRDLQGMPVYVEKFIEGKTIETWANELVLEIYDLPVLLVHAPEDMTYGELLDHLAPVRDLFDTYYIFL